MRRTTNVPLAAMALLARPERVEPLAVEGEVGLAIGHGQRHVCQVILIAAQEIVRRYRGGSVMALDFRARKYRSNVSSGSTRSKATTVGKTAPIGGRPGVTVVAFDSRIADAFPQHADEDRRADAAAGNFRSTVCPYQGHQADDEREGSSGEAEFLPSLAGQRARCLAGKAER
jgi:hypothetical protein